MNEDLGDGSASGPLSSEDLRVLDRVFARRKSLARAVTLALGNAVFALVSACFCIPFSFLDPSLLLVAVVLAATGVVELKGSRMLRALDTRAPKWLALNQVALFLAIAVYCGFAISNGMRPSPSAGAGSDALGEFGESLGAVSGSGLLDHAYTGALIGVYVVLLLACGLYQGACAWFYASRAPVLRAHRAESPSWALALERRLLGW